MLPERPSVPAGPLPMRIGYLMKMYPRFSETFIVTEMLGLQARGVDLEIFSLRTPTDGRFHPDLAKITAPVHYLQPGSVKAEQLWAALAGYVQRFGSIGDAQLTDLLHLEPREAAQALDLAVAVADRRITHLHAHFGSVATSVARAAAGLAGIGYTFTAHAKDIFHQDVDPVDLTAKLSDADAVITVSDFNHRYLRERYGDAADRVRRIYNGIDLAQFGYTEPRVEPSDSGPPLIAAVGRLVQKKGFDDLVAAAGRLRDHGRDFRMQIAGTGPVAEDLEKQIADLGLQDRVWLSGPLPQDQVRRLVGSASVFAAPCVVGTDGNRDGLPTVLLEAMALGTACVSTPVTGIPEAIEHRRTGLLVSEHDPAGLAAALDELLSDAALRIDLGRAARDRIESDFDAAGQAGRIADLFTDLHRRKVTRS